MSKVIKLTAEQRQQLLQPLLNNKGWTYEPESDNSKEIIVKKFIFKNFIEAFGFMSQVALNAEKQDHHPEWSNCYNWVEVGWSTHDCSGLSLRDIQAAEFCDKIHYQIQ